MRLVFTGTQGTSSAANGPGARERPTSWSTPAGEFWIWGVFGNGEASGTGYLSDLWKFSTSSGLWTWMSASKILNDAPLRGSVGQFSYSYTPGGRNGASGW